MTAPAGSEQRLRGAVLGRRAATGWSCLRRTADVVFASRAGAGMLAGWTLVAVANTIWILFALSLPAGGFALQWAHVATSAAELVALGIVSAVAVALWLQWVRVPKAVSIVAYLAVTCALVHATLQFDIWRRAVAAFEGKFDVPLYWALVLVAGGLIVTAHGIGDRLSRMRWAWLLPLLGAVVALVVDHLIFRDNYYAVHAVVAWGAAVLGGGALSTRALGVLNRVRSKRMGRTLLPAVMGSIVIFALVPPSNAVRVELFREPCSVGAWVLAATLWEMPEPSAPVPSELADSPWFSPRHALSPVPPTSPRLVPKNPLVVLITIDGVRADVVAAPANERTMPTFTSMRRSGTSFSHAISPGSQTAISLTTVFSGRYFSQLEWRLHGVGSSRFQYAASDPSPRFPEILTSRGVVTASVCSVYFFANDFGIARGFTDAVMIPRGREHARGTDVIDALLARIQRVDARPTFLFAHLMDPHLPYDTGELRDGPDLDRYVSEVAAVDGLVGRVQHALRSRFPDRAVLIVSSDHGEAFGEHDTRQHTKTLYDELLRVPLMVTGPNVVARRIEEPVSVIDLGPTILDLFGLETPPGFFGQSLVPLLAGRDTTLTRPLLAEGRMRRMLLLGSMKVIEDQRRKTVEAYDLTRDPGELDNLWGRDARADQATAMLRRFFDIHTLRLPGYAHPYRP